MDDFFGWIILGLVAGVIGKIIMPGKDPGGFVVTILLGITGALLAGFVGQIAGFYGPGERAGWLASIAGAVVLLIAYRLIPEPRR